MSYYPGGVEVRLLPGVEKQCGDDVVIRLSRRRWLAVRSCLAALCVVCLCLGAVLAVDVVGTQSRLASIERKLKRHCDRQSYAEAELQADSDSYWEEDDTIFASGRRARREAAVDRKDNAKKQTPNKPPPNPDGAIHLKAGNLGIITQGHGTRLIRGWTSSNNQQHQSITIKKNGLYLIYAQISYRTVATLSGFKVVVLRNNKGSREQATQCTVGVDYVDAQRSHIENQKMKTCYTATVVQLEKGHVIELHDITLTEEEAGVYMDSSFSYWGVVHIMNQRK